MRNLEALACEHFASFAVTKGDMEWAKDYMERAHGLYTEWGALGKSQQMEKEFPDLLKDVHHRHIIANTNRKFDHHGGGAGGNGRAWWNSSNGSDSSMLE